MGDSRANWEKILRAPTFAGHLHENDILGSGRYADVFRYTNSKDQQFAVKRIRLVRKLKYYETPPTPVENIDLHSSLKHRNIVKFHGVWRSKRSIYLFLDLMEGGDLQTLIDTSMKQNKVLRKRTVKSYTEQMLKGLEYLHNLTIVHRDLKPANILLGSYRTVLKLSDFSLSRVVSALAEKFTPTTKGSFHYMAPEVVRCEQFTVKSDIWSVGAIMIAMLTGSPPFSNIETDATLILRIAQLGQSDMKPEYELPRGKSECTQKLLDEIFQPSPTDRPTASDLLEHDYFKPKSERMPNDPAPESEYSFVCEHKGRVLIINNINYESDSNTVRDGSILDASKLFETFNNIGFKVRNVQDLTADKVRAEITGFVSHRDNSRYSSFIISILSHGSESGIIGTDDQEVSLKDIRALVVPAQLLLGKPKLLLIQACRGPNRDEARVVPDAAQPTDIMTTNLDSQPTDNLTTKIDLKTSNSVDDNFTASPNIQRKVDYSGKFEGDGQNFVTVNSDVLIAHSTCSGYVSYRNTAKGSIFIQSICESITENWREKSVPDMLIIANEKVSTAQNEQDNEIRVQTPSSESTLKKQFFLSTKSERRLPKPKRVANSRMSGGRSRHTSVPGPMSTDRSRSQSHVRFNKKRSSSASVRSDRSDASEPDSSLEHGRGRSTARSGLFSTASSQKPGKKSGKDKKKADRSRPSSSADDRSDAGGLSYRSGASKITAKTRTGRPIAIPLSAASSRMSGKKSGRTKKTADRSQPSSSADDRSDR